MGGRVLIDGMQVCAYCGLAMLGGRGARYNSHFTTVAAPPGVEFPPYAYAAIAVLMVGPSGQPGGAGLRKAWEPAYRAGRRADGPRWVACRACAAGGNRRAARMATLAPMPPDYSALLLRVPLQQAMLLSLVDLRPQFSSHAYGYVSGKAAGVALINAPLTGMHGDALPDEAVSDVMDVAAERHACVGELSGTCVGSVRFCMMI